MILFFCRLGMSRPVFGCDGVVVLMAFLRCGGVVVSCRRYFCSLVVICCVVLLL